MEDDDAVKPWRGGDTYVDQGWERGGREGGAGRGGGSCCLLPVPQAL